MFKHRFFKALGHQPTLPDAYPILSAEALLQQNDRPQRIAQIRQRAAAPQESFDAVYHPLIKTFAAYVQSLPVAENALCLLDYVLMVTVRALARRHGHLLPQGGDAQDVSAQEGLWTYAVTCAALLRPLGKIVVAQWIQLLDNDNNSLGKWEPFHGPMGGIGEKNFKSRARRYQVEFLPDCPPGLPPRASLMLAPAVIPAKGMAWLLMNPQVFHDVVFCIGGNPEAAGPLGQLIQDAESEFAVQSPSTAPVLGASDTQKRGTAATVQENAASPDEVTPELSTPYDMTAECTDTAGVLDAGTDTETVLGAHEDPKDDSQATQSPSVPTASRDLGESFLAWLREGITTGRIPINHVGGFVHRVPEGVLLASPLAFKTYADETAQAWKPVQKSFFKLKRHRVGAGGNNMVTYQVIRQGHVKGQLSGVLMEMGSQVLGEREVEVNTWLVKSG